MGYKQSPPTLNQRKRNARNAHSTQTRNERHTQYKHSPFRHPAPNPPLINLIPRHDRQPPVLEAQPSDRHERRGGDEQEDLDLAGAAHFVSASFAAAGLLEEVIPEGEDGAAEGQDEGDGEEAVELGAAGAEEGGGFQERHFLVGCFRSFPLGFWTRLLWRRSVQIGSRRSGRASLEGRGAGRMGVIARARVRAQHAGICFEGSGMS